MTKGNPEDYSEVSEVSDLIVTVCSLCGIPTFAHNLSDEEIARVCRWIGEHAPGSKKVDGEVIIGVDGFDAMIFITITDFPQFFEEHKLGMVRRN